jgi:hypothetical protein
MCGRSAGLTNRHLGNIELRNRVSARKEEYLGSRDKGAIIRGLVQEWTDEGRRFMRREREATGASRWVEAPLDNKVTDVFYRLFTRVPSSDPSVENTASSAGPTDPRTDAEGTESDGKEGHAPAPGSLGPDQLPMDAEPTTRDRDEVRAPAQGSVAFVDIQCALHPKEDRKLPAQSSQSSMATGDLSSMSAHSSSCWRSGDSLLLYESLSSLAPDRSQRNVVALPSIRAGRGGQFQVDLDLLEAINQSLEQSVGFPSLRGSLSDVAQQGLGEQQYEASALSSESEAWLEGQYMGTPAQQTSRLAAATDHGNLTAPQARPALQRWMATRTLPSVPEDRRSEVHLFQAARGGSPQGAQAAPLVKAAHAQGDLPTEGIAPLPHAPSVACLGTDQATSGAMATVISSLPQTVRALYERLHQQLPPLGAPRMPRPVARGADELGGARMNSGRSNETHGSNRTSMSGDTLGTFSVRSNSDMSVDVERARAYFSDERT